MARAGAKGSWAGYCSARTTETPATFCTSATWAPASTTRPSSTPRPNSRRWSARRARSRTRCRARARGAYWVEPVLVGEVFYRQFTPREHRLRHTAWRGWRPDKTPAEVKVPLLQ
ncbi:hypothetical protein [Amycolatopsis sp. NPDC051372]|uniref:ATP dependent DNA ligase n=1 Tax=Amycolatopsis sp. NPDC051372 TaxID=3155669 RepID=UPI00343BADFB